MASGASAGQRWVNVTPLVFLACSVVGWVGFAVPALVRALLPGWAQGRVWILTIALPPALACLVWRAYSKRIGRTKEAGRVGWLAFWASLAWPVCVFGLVLFSALIAWRIPSVREDENAGEVLVFLFFMAGSAVATAICWLLSQSIVRALWPKPVRHWT